MLLHYSYYMTLVLQCIYCYTQRATDRHIDCFSIIQVTMTCRLYKLHWFVTFFFCSRRFSFFLSGCTVHSCRAPQFVYDSRPTRTLDLTKSDHYVPARSVLTVCSQSVAFRGVATAAQSLKCHWTITGEMLLIPPPGGSCVVFRSVLTVVTDVRELKPTSNPSTMMDKGLDEGPCGEASTVSLLNVIRNSKQLFVG